MHLSTDTMYEQADLIAVVQVIESHPVEECFMFPCQDVKVQVEQRLRGPEEPPAFWCTLVGQSETKRGDRFIVFLKQNTSEGAIQHGPYSDFGGGQGVHRVSEKDTVVFQWWPSFEQAYVKDKGHINIVTIPNMPVDRTILLIKTILKLEPTTRTIDRIRTLVIDQLSDLDPYALFWEQQPGWGLTTLRTLGFPNTDQILTRMLQQAADPETRKRIQEVIKGVRQDRIDRLVQTLTEELKQQLDEANVLDRLDGDPSIKRGPTLVLHILVTPEGSVASVRISPDAWSIKRRVEAKPEQLTEGQLQIMDEISAWKFSTRPEVHVTLHIGAYDSGEKRHWETVEWP